MQAQPVAKMPTRPAPAPAAAAAVPAPAVAVPAPAVAAPAPAAPTLVTPPPELHLALVSVCGLFWVAQREAWPELVPLLSEVAFFMSAEHQDQQPLVPTYLDWPIDDIRGDQGEHQALQALIGKIKQKLKPGDHLLFVGEQVSEWLAKCPEVYEGHATLALPQSETLLGTASAKRTLWQWLDQLKAS